MSSRWGVASSRWCRRVAPWVAICTLLGCDAFDAGLLKHRAPAKASTRANDAGTQREVEDAGAAAQSEAKPPLDAWVPPLDAADSSSQPVVAARDASSDEDTGGKSCRPSAVADYCAELPELPAAPLIDGAPDCGPPLLRVPPTAWNGKAALPASLSAWLAVAYRENGVYVYVEIRGQAPVPHPSDQAIYCGDAVELYMDGDGSLDASGNYDSPGTMQFIVAAPTASSAAGIDAERFVKGASQGVWRTDAVERVLPDGYAVEMFIRDADLGLTAWSPSVRAGIDLAIDVSGAAGDPNLRCGRLLGQFFMRVGMSSGSCSGEPWCDSLAFCTPMLL